MSIAYVQSSAVVSFTGDATTKNLSLTGVAAGNSILVCTKFAVFTSTEPVISANDGNAYTEDLALWASGLSTRIKLSVHRYHAATSGNKTITLSFTGPSAANVYGDTRAYEFSGLADASPDKSTATSGTSSTPATPATGGLSQANNLVLALMMADMSGIDLPTSFTNLWLDDTTSGNPPNSDDYRIISSAADLSVAWGTLASSAPWAAGVVVYKEAASVNAQTKSDTIATLTDQAIATIIRPTSVTPAGLEARVTRRRIS